MNEHIGFIFFVKRWYIPYEKKILAFYYPFNYLFTIFSLSSSEELRYPSSKFLNFFYNKSSLSFSIKFKIFPHINSVYKNSSRSLSLKTYLSNWLLCLYFMENTLAFEEKRSEVLHHTKLVKKTMLLCHVCVHLTA